MSLQRLVVTKGWKGQGSYFSLLFLSFLPVAGTGGYREEENRERSLPSRNLHSSRGRQTINKMNKNNRVYRTVTSAMERIKQGKGIRTVVRV